MRVQVLGPGCAKCEQLLANVQQAVEDLGLGVEVEKIADLKEIAKFRVLTTPALVLNGQVKSAGKLLPVEEIKKLLSEAGG